MSIDESLREDEPFQCPFEYLCQRIGESCDNCPIIPLVDTFRFVNGQIFTAIEGKYEKFGD